MTGEDRHLEEGAALAVAEILAVVPTSVEACVLVCGPHMGPVVVLVA